MEAGDLVRKTDTSEEGVVVTDSFGCCSSDEVPVVFFGTSHFEGTLAEKLEVIGRYEAQPDPVKCGAGRGADCCIFLTTSPNGFECQRFSHMRNILIFKKMSAERNPTEPFPECMKF